MSGPDRGDLQEEAAELLSTAGDAELTVDELRASVRGLVSDAGSTESNVLGILVNGSMTLAGVAVAWHFAGWVGALGVAWAIFNVYPLALAGWRWLLS